MQRKAKDLQAGDIINVIMRNAAGALEMGGIQRTVVSVGASPDEGAVTVTFEPVWGQRDSGGFAENNLYEVQ